MKVNKFTTINPKGEEFTFEPEVTHPKGMIKLLDGNLIEGFPRQVATKEVDNKLSLDTTGEYFQIRKKKPTPPQEDEDVKAERERLERLFYQNAFFFLFHKERILSDSRMFLTPVPVESGLAYTGTSGFRNPTLGVYVEWWSSFGASRVVGDDGSTMLIWHIAGSPLSGSNRCSAVGSDGISHIVSVSPFSDTWRSFIGLNTRYDECKQYEAYSLEKALAILKQEPIDENEYARFLLNMRIDGLLCKIKQLERRIDYIYQEKSTILSKYLRFRVLKEYDKSKRLLDEYKERARVCEEKIDEQNQRKKMVKAHRENYNATTFQNAIMSANREKERLKADLQQFRDDSVKEIFPDGDVKFGTMAMYVDQIDKEQDANNT